MYPTISLQPSQTYNPEVVKLQNWLVTQGVMSAADAASNPGFYGPKTTAAVKAWQEKNGINAGADAGYWGPISIKKASGTTTTQPTTPTNTQSNTSGTTYQNVPITGKTDAEIAKQVSVIDANIAAGRPPEAPAVTPPPTPPTDTTGGGTDTPAYDPATYAHYGKGEYVAGEKEQHTVLHSAEQVASLNKLIGASALSEIMNNPSQEAFYIHALTYGGYKIEDVVRDMKKIELEKTPGVKLPTLISVEQPKSTYYASDTGKTALAAIGSNADLSKINSSSFPNMGFFQYGIDIPDEVFKTLVPLSNPDSPEYKAAVAAVKSTGIDLSNALLNANTEQEFAFAKSQYDEFRKQVQEKYGIALSTDVLKAQDQLETIGQSASKAGLFDSGFQKEETDKMLRGVRRSTDILRSQKLTDEESKRADYYRKYASSSQIAALTPEERNKYGLTASPDIIQQFSLANLKTLYPDKTDKELQAYHDAVIDDGSGTPVLRSSLYQKKFTDINTNETNRVVNAKTEVDAKALDTENRTYANYDGSQPFSSSTSGNNATVQGAVNNTTGSTTGGTSGLPNANPSTGYTFTKDANGNIVTKLNGQTVSTGTAAGATSYGYKP